jgi:hypothetical protein
VLQPRFLFLYIRAEEPLLITHPISPFYVSTHSAFDHYCFDWKRVQVSSWILSRDLDCNLDVRLA